MSINKIRLPDNTEHTLDARLLDGYSAQKYYPAVAYNFTTGCFCKTTIDAGANTIYVEIVGRNHATSGSFVNTQAKAQYASGAFVSAQCKAVRYGDSIGNITFCVHDGKICFWFKVATAYCSFYVTCRAGGASRNYIDTITNETIPSDATGNIVVTPTVTFQESLVSGTNIKTINNESLLGEGNISISSLPSAASSDNGLALITNSGAWTIGWPAGIQSMDNRRIINSTVAPLYRYKICGFSRYGRLVPLTITDQTSSTIVDKVPNTSAIDPQRGLVYYSGTTTVTATSSSVGSLFHTRSRIDPRYTFNESVPAAREIYLKGTYDGHVFNLDTSSHTSWYVYAYVYSDSATFFGNFVTGSYYMFVGNTGSTENKMELSLNNPLYYFDGSYLIQVNLDSRVPTVLSGSSAPTSSQGNDGDIYIQTS